MIHAERIPGARSETPAGREMRCAHWLLLLRSATRDRRMFVMTKLGACGDQSVSIRSLRGQPLCSIPRKIFRSWTQRIWIESLGQHGRGEVWSVTDVGKEAAHTANTQDVYHG